MRYGLLATAAILITQILSAAAAPPPQPASRPASGSLPAGHPVISMPATQPVGPGALPAGHPAVITQRPTTGPAATVGTLKITVKQGTKNGPSLAGHAATVDLY